MWHHDAEDGICNRSFVLRMSLCFARHILLPLIPAILSPPSLGNMNRVSLRLDCTNGFTQ